MRAAIRLAGLGLAAAAGCADSLGAQERSRLDARLLLGDRVSAVAELRPTPPDRFPGPGAFGALSTVADPDDGVRVFVRGTEGVEEAIAAVGGRAGLRAGDVVAAVVPRAALVRLARDPAVVRVGPVETLVTQLARPPVARPGARAFRLDGGDRAWEPFPGPSAGLRPSDALPEVSAGLRPRDALLDVSAGLWPRDALDLSAADVNVGPLRQRVSERFEGVAGQGVIVGIVDSGLDLDHPDFRGPDGSTRVLFALDLTDAGGPAPGVVGSRVFADGSECDAAAIDAGACRMRDFRGHGTHVLGIAAGDGSATGNGQPPFRYVGVAPEADLIVVKGGEAAFAADDVLEGVAYVFERAAELGRPAVVVLALGTQAGPHDGTTPFETALDALVGPGRILVVTAGNQGAYDNETPDFPAGPIHLAGLFGTEGNNSHTVVVPAYVPRAGVGNDAVLLEVWYEGVIEVALTVTPPGGEPLRVAHGDTLAAQTPRGAVFIDNASLGPSADNGDHQAVILLFDAVEGEEPAEGAWGFEVELEGPLASRGPYHGWIVGSTFEGAIATPRIGLNAANSHVVTTPGNADRVIAVGAHATRHAWPGRNGTETFAFREPLGDVGFFSSPGPRRDGVTRPDLTAPGKMVVSSLVAGGTDFAPLPSLVEADGVHAALLGTSMAAPHVAGAAALLLQLQPDLTPEEVRAILRGSARVDGFVDARGGAPSGAWGFGKLDALAAARAIGSAVGELLVAAAPARAPSAAVEGRSGEVLPLFALTLSASGPEPIFVDELRVRVEGADPGAALLLVLDEDLDGAVDAGEQELASVPVVAGDGDLGGALTVPADRTLDALVALRLGGGVPNGTTIRATLPAGGIGAQGVLSAADPLAAPSGAVSSPAYRVNLLAAAEDVALSANPVRGDRLVVSYPDTPRRAGVYTAAGRLVREFSAEVEPGPGRIVWDLTDAAGTPVANGAYYLFLDLPGGRVLRTVYVVRP